MQLFGGWNIGGLLSKPPIRQNKFPAKISGHTVVPICIDYLQRMCELFNDFKSGKPRWNALYTARVRGLKFIYIPNDRHSLSLNALIHIYLPLLYTLVPLQIAHGYKPDTKGYHPTCIWDIWGISCPLWGLPLSCRQHRGGTCSLFSEDTQVHVCHGLEHGGWYHVILLCVSMLYYAVYRAACNVHYLFNVIWLIASHLIIHHRYLHFCLLDVNVLPVKLQEVQCLLVVYCLQRHKAYILDKLQW